VLSKCLNSIRAELEELNCTVEVVNEGDCGYHMRVYNSHTEIGNIISFGATYLHVSKGDLHLHEIKALALVMETVCA
jgi:hypothetical protein